MERRAYIVDILRGVAILGMVLSGQMLWHSELPAWMFHAQLPPPTFAFDPSVPGITWVDLVFPFFLFAMGAAFPLAMERRLRDRGEAKRYLAVGILKRWVLLTLFALVLANLRIRGLEGVPTWGAAGVGLLEWGCFSLLFLRFSGIGETRRALYRLIGGVGLLLLALASHWLWGVELSLEKSDVILLILANVVLFGSFIWLLTRQKPLLRLGVLALLVALRIGSTVEGSWQAALWSWSPLPWLFQFDYLKYLCIIIPGTLAGEAIDRWLRSEPAKGRFSRKREAIATGLIAGLFLLNMWGLFTRHLAINFVGSMVVGGAVWALLRGGESPSEVLRRELFTMAWVWLTLGLLCEPFEGGIKKDFATFSYFFVTSGLALMLLTACSSWMEHFGLRLRPLIECGENPMIAYTAAELVIMPLMSLMGLAPWFERMAASSPWAGFGRGVVMTLLVMALSAWLTRRKYFWRT